MYVGGRGGEGGGGLVSTRQAGQMVAALIALSPKGPGGVTIVILVPCQKAICTEPKADQEASSWWREEGRGWGWEGACF